MSKKPKGITWARKNGNIYVGWKHGESGYTAQQFQYKLNKGSWHTKSVSRGAKKTTIELSYSNYYPNGGKVDKITVRIRGKKGGKWSGWESKSHKLSTPKKPTLTATLDDTLTNQSTFAWITEYSDIDWHPFTNVAWQSILLKESDITDTEKLAKLFDPSAQDGETNLDRQTGTGTASDSEDIAEDTNLLADNSYTRWFRVQSRGLAGASGWAYEKHVYATPYKAEIIPENTNAEQGVATIDCRVGWKAEATPSHPIDQTIVKYLITPPAENMSFPAGTDMQEVNVSADTKEEDAARFIVEGVLQEDDCLFFAVDTLHDKNKTPGDAYLALVGKLAKPSTLSYQTDNTAHTITITDISNDSEVVDSKLAIIYKSGSEPDKELVVGIVPHGSSSPLVSPVVCPDWSNETSFTIGVRAFVGDHIKNKKTVIVNEQEVQVDDIGYTITPRMVSETYWVGGSVPVSPQNVLVDPTTVVGTARVVWDWAWEDATHAQLSWTDHADAWESTDEPEIYTVPRSRATKWNIANLDTGKTWYVAVRLANGNPETDEVIFSPWSTPVSITLTADSAVAMPTFTLSANAITRDEQLVASWVYTANDGSEQVYAAVHEAVVSGDETTYSETPIAHAETEQETVIDISSLGWDYGETHYLAVQIKSASGKVSEWSNVASVTIAPKLEASITSTSLVGKQLTVDDAEQTTDTFLCLDQLPLTVNVSGNGDGVTTTLIIKRYGDYEVERPDESQMDGFDGETIYVYSPDSGSQFVVNLSDLIGRLDDGAWYSIKLLMQDGYGQTTAQFYTPVQTTTGMNPLERGWYENTEFGYVLTTDTEPVSGKTYYAKMDSLNFKVSWEHQAIPLDANSADITIDQNQMIATIIPIAPTGIGENDTCDIYRLSADKPELLYKGAEFDTQYGYVDPYPTIGVSGGYRLVFITEYGDYIIGDSEAPSWHDFKASGASDEDFTLIDKLDTEYTIIDFDGNQLMLKYNIDTTDAWEKDAQATTYMGGSITIDHNKAVKRSGTINGIILTVTDQEEIEMLRRLAVYTGLCHVRTQSGSSYTASISVTEDHDHEKYGKMASFTMSITKSDPNEPDGLTYAEWIG